MADRAKRRKAPRRYLSRPQEVEAVQWTGDEDDVDAIVDFALDEGLELLAGKDGAQKWVPVPVGHWVVRNPGNDSDYWPVDADYFAGKYRPANTIGGRIVEEDTGNGTTYRSSHMVVQELRVPPCRWCGRAQDALVFDRVNETLMADCAKHRDGADIILDRDDLVCLGLLFEWWEDDDDDYAGTLDVVPTPWAPRLRRRITTAVRVLFGRRVWTSDDTIDVSGEGLYAHPIGDTACTEGWCSDEFPREHEDCGGLVHADFGDEHEDGFWVHTRCDRCGETP